jgi:hypothetical protein
MQAANFEDLPYTRPASVGEPGTRKCGRQTRDGKPCNNYALIGATVCMIHGGGTPMAKAAARKRLMMIFEPALMVAYEIMMDDLNEPEVRLKAALAIIDRCGHGPNMKLEVDDRRRDLSELTPLQMRERAERVLQLAAAQAATESAIEGEVVKQTDAA